MEDLDLPRRYRSIFLAGATFNLLATDDVALRALRAIHAHLTDDGTALVPLFVPAPTPADQVGAFRSVVTDEARRSAWAWSTRTGTPRPGRAGPLLRYERVTAAGVEQVDRVWLLHWHTPAGFGALAAEAGLVVLDGPVDDDAEEFTFRLGRTRRGGVAQSRNVSIWAPSSTRRSWSCS